jgi:ATP-dependent Clp protease protease subunit
VDIQIAAKQIQRLQDSTYKILSENTGKTVEEIEKACNNGDNWFTAEEAKDFGLVDNIITKQEA